MKLNKITPLIFALFTGTAIAAAGDNNATTDSTTGAPGSMSSETYGGSQDNPAYQKLNNDGGIELQNNNASAGVRDYRDDSPQSPLHSGRYNGASATTDSTANNVSVEPAGSGYSSGFEGSK